MAEELAVWLDRVRVAAIRRDGRRLHLSYTEDALARFELGTPLLSISLPLVAEPYPQGVVRAFLDGLLPEGEPRRTLERDLGIRANDTFALIRALGRDCAGALIIQPADEPAPSPGTTRTAEPLTEQELGELVANLRSAPLGVGGRVRVSLAGVQEKLLLTRMRDGTWGRPVEGTPSTHILKPEIAAFPMTVENEAFSMRVAKYLDLDVASVETTSVVGRKLIVVERFDRVVQDDGRVQRLHQEDFCQATGTPPDQKYEDDGGPSLRRIAGIVQTAASPAALEDLLRAATVNVLLGNGDAHAKNFSLLHEPSGALRLAPLYDLMSTLHYGDDRLAMYIDDVRRIERVTGERLVNEVARWGLSDQRASEILADLVARAPQAFDAARDETEGLPDQIFDVVRAQHARLAGSV